MRNITLLLLLIGMILPNAKSAPDLSNIIDPEISEIVSQLSPDEVVHVELAIAGGVVASELIEEMDRLCSTLHERRLYGLRKLRQIAENTQRDILSYLQILEESGLAANVQSHWLTNTISVDLAASQVNEVSAEAGVQRVFQYPEYHQMVPEFIREDQSRKSGAQLSVEPNVSYIGADSAWALGYTGEGRIVCVFDASGVDGSHPALYDNWKGHDGNPRAACRNCDFPTAHTSHGTLLAGIMIGHDDSTGDTIGVAPGAQWIFGGFAGWEWAADPDEDPNTTADMPDVINISMLTNTGCYDRWWDQIDMVEALGIVVVNSAGNYGPGPMTVGSPATRADDSLTNFAVGSIDHRNSEVYISSGRGPSSCDSVSIKPNLCAPGAYVRSSIVDGGYMITGGTSVASPHVAGAIAILRQFAPNTTAREIKEALLAGATPRGTPYPNNDYGWGILNIVKSMEFLERAHLIPSTHKLEQNYPNPFNSTTTIEYYLSEDSHVTMTIYNILGQHVRTIVDGRKGTGYNVAVWDGNDERSNSVSSGVYLYELKAGSTKLSRKMVFLK
ncbi:MAG: S8 family peptidase [candidate division Zixibacteria bacterium]|nr:S8 family peptidase [candidate division Zixibacteria bacterium]